MPGLSEAKGAAPGPVGWFVGLATLDVIQLVDVLPAPNQKTTAKQTWLAAGGPATVAAIAFAALGGRAVLWTALGGGAAADAIRADLASAGVEVIDAAPDGFEVATSSVLLDAATGERAVISGSGHRPHLASPPKPDLTAADVVLIDGHHAELAAAAAREASASGLPVVVDAGSHKPVFDQLLTLSTDVICSADYVHPAGLTPAELAAGRRLLAVSHGADALVWWSDGEHGVVQPPSAPVVDTLSAGDVLHGAYAFGLASGWSRLGALEFAVQVASIRVRRLGPFAWRHAMAAG